MGELLIQSCDPFLQGLQSERGKKRARLHARKLQTRPEYRAKMEKIYRTWVGYFERHIEYPVLWMDNPLEIEYFLLALEAHAAHLPKGTFPPIEDAIQRLQSVARQSKNDRKRHLPKKKIIRLSQFQRAPQSF